MSASAVFSIARQGLASCGIPASGLLLAATLAASGAQAQSNPCAIYGAGFVPVYGGDACVRIGGRVRVDAAIAPSQNVYGHDFRPNAAPLDGPDRAHLRLQGGTQTGMPRTR